MRFIIPTVARRTAIRLASETGAGGGGAGLVVWGMGAGGGGAVRVVSGAGAGGGGAVLVVSG
ncbi:MAG: hypothetical protein WD204_04925, partial [Acidimicrobiia bacterium]